MKKLELLLPPVLVVVLIAVAMTLSARLVDIPLGEIPVHRLGAWLLFVLGCLIVFAAGLYFRRAQTTVNPTTPFASSSLVTSGVYRLSRNPMYLGFLLWLTALAVWLGDYLVTPWLAAYVLYLNRFQIRPEERFLRRQFGEEYARYCQRVRRWC